MPAAVMSKQKTATETPLMQQHRAIKAKYPDAILLFRVGDFYETFGQDAVIASRVLGITLTKRNNGSAADNELAGFPHHALDTYLHKLVKAGYRVAICDQLEDPKTVKGIVKRGVTEMVTPGTATNDKLLDLSSNNFLAAVHFNGEVYGMAFLGTLPIGHLLMGGLASQFSVRAAFFTSALVLTAFLAILYLRKWNADRTIARLAL